MPFPVLKPQMLLLLHLWYHSNSTGLCADPPLSNLSHCAVGSVLEDRWAGPGARRPQRAEATQRDARVREVRPAAGRRSAVSDVGRCRHLLHRVRHRVCEGGNRQLRQRENSERLNFYSLTWNRTEVVLNSNEVKVDVHFVFDTLNGGEMPNWTVRSEVKQLSGRRKLILINVRVFWTTENLEETRTGSCTETLYSSGSNSRIVVSHRRDATVNLRFSFKFDS